jgi:hypothetical protein
MFFILLALILLPIIAGSRIPRLGYIGISSAAVAFFGSYYGLLRPQESLPELLLTILVMGTVGVLYTNRYFLDAIRKRF